MTKPEWKSELMLQFRMLEIKLGKTQDSDLVQRGKDLDAILKDYKGHKRALREYRAVLDNTSQTVDALDDSPLKSDLVEQAKKCDEMLKKLEPKR